LSRFANAVEAKYPTKGSRLSLSLMKSLSLRSLAPSSTFALFSNANFEPRAFFFSSGAHAELNITDAHKSNCRAAIYMTIALSLSLSLLFRVGREGRVGKAFSPGVHKYLRHAGGNTNREIDPASLCLL
jgi:hypothetical protein